MTFNYFMITILPYILSGLTLYKTHMNGKFSTTSWLFGALIQVIWLVWILYTKNWGFLIMNIGLTMVYLKNYFAWRRIPAHLLDAAKEAGK